MAENKRQHFVPRMDWFVFGQTNVFIIILA